MSSAASEAFTIVDLVFPKVPLLLFLNGCQLEHVESSSMY